jgi:hypothetical protein
MAFALPRLVALRWLVILVSGPTLVCALAACSGGSSTNPASAQSETTEPSGSGGFGQRNVNDPKSNDHAGQGGAKHGAGAGTAGANDAEAGDGNAGASDAEAGAAGAVDPGPPPPPCDLEGNCESQCRTKVTCGIQAANECEFAGFDGATVEVGCGQRASVGVACCGACGCVPVEVYFDGTSCWQGIAECNGRLVSPHAPTTPNPSFTPNSSAYGNFYPGGAGAGAGGGAGASGASSGGGPSSGGSSGAAGTVTVGSE